MDIKLFSLIKSESSSFTSEKKIIAECANAFTAENEKFKNFSSMKRVLLASSQALRSADAIIIAVQASLFNSAKKAFCTSFRLESEQNEKIHTALSGKKLSASAVMNHSLFPKNAEIFACEDFIYCGFSITSGAQSIILIPLDSIKTGEIVFGYLFDYLAFLAGIDNAEELSKLKRFCIMKRNFDILSASGRTVCFASTNATASIPEIAGYVDKENKIFRFSKETETKPAMQSANDFIVNAAKKARESASCTYGCAVSNAFSSTLDNSVYVLYAISDKEKTDVTKVFAEEGENPKKLITCATEKMLERIGYAEISSIKKEKEKVNKATNAAKRRASSIFAAAVGGATALCALLSLILNQ